MSHPILNDPKLYTFLLQIDEDLASATREKGCPHCGGILHSARYPRKPQGLSVDLDPAEGARFSFCCSVDGCRRRVTPPSVRFLGRKRYLSALIVLLSAMLQDPNQRRPQGLATLTGVSRKTLLRWQTWWRETFPSSRFWRYCQSFIQPPVDSDCLCRELVNRFSAQHELTSLGRLLRFLSPLSCPSPTVELLAL